MVKGTVRMKTFTAIMQSVAIAALGIAVVQVSHTNIEIARTVLIHGQAMRGLADRVQRLEAATAVLIERQIDKTGLIGKEPAK
jgi:hypothetical protein